MSRYSEGAKVVVGSRTYRITYIGGSGHDVVLRAVSAGTVFFAR